MDATPGQPFTRETTEPQTDEAAPLDLSPAPPPPPQPSTSTAHRVLFGRFGLRAGYGIAIWFIAFLAISILASLAALAATGHLAEVRAAHEFAKAHPNAVHPHPHIDFVPLFVMVSDGISFLGLLGVCWLFSKGEHRPLRVYGIGRYRIADIVPGAVWGVAIMCVLVLVLRSLHLLIFDSRALHGAAVFLYGAKWLLAFLVVGFSEEYSFRGYLQYSLMRGVWGLAEHISPTRARAVAFWIAATLLSLLFAVAHTGNGGETPFGIAQVFLAGIVFSYALWHTGSLWWGIGFHMAWDWAQSFLFGVADSGNVSVGRLFITHPAGRNWLSGGPDGPEGSIFATIALLLTLLVIRLVRPGAQPAIEPESSPMPEFYNSPA
jgi:membrane protease YdiL (CAAX protease family)